jgi:Family of unknown function (DUF5681)
MRRPRKTNTDRAQGVSTDYEVGYRRPPVHARFKTGQSGNPKGRPKGRKKMGALLEDALNERISIREGDAVRKVSRAEATVLALISKAMKGDAKAFSTLLAFAQQSGEFEKEPPRIDYIRRIYVKPGNLRLGTAPEVWER